MKKPFNPILGETFEMVTEKVKFVAEQVSHHPPITAFQYEGKGFTSNGASTVNQHFRFGGGKGQLEFE